MRVSISSGGCCTTDANDLGSHVVCARVTAEFLRFSIERGNDLVTPRPEFRFAGLKPGDRWCLCALRWKEALEAGAAPPVVLDSTHERALAYVTLEPCSFHGRTPSCAKALVARGIQRVVVAMLDPDPRNAGAGIDILKAAAVEISVGVRRDEVTAQLLPYLTHRRTGRPFVVCKLASTLVKAALS